MPKILILSTAYFPLVGGAEVAVKEITDRVEDFEFDMITAQIKLGLAKFEKIGNINVYRVGFGFWFDKYLLPFLGLRKAKQLERKNNYNLTWSIMASFGGFLGLRFKKKYPNKPWLLTLQEGDPPREIEEKVGIFKFWFYQIFKRADYFQAISSFLYNWAITNGAKSGEIVPNGVDIRKFKQASGETIKELKEELGIKNEKVILTVSRLVKKNGIDDLIKSGQYLGFPFKILIAGSGEQEKELKYLAKKINLEDKVIFLGHINYNDLPKYYSTADIFVRPALSEGFGNVFVEAMAAGVPVIGTSVGGIPDFLKDRETGLFCEVRNPKNIAQKIREILENDNLRNHLINNGLELVEKEYNWGNIVLKMEEVFKNQSFRSATPKFFRSRTPNRLLILTGVFLKDVGGPPTLLKALNLELIKRGYKITVLTFGKREEVKKYPYLVKVVCDKWPGFLKSFFFLIKGLILGLKADIIYNQDLYAPGFVGLIIKKILGKKLVTRFVGDSAWETALNIGETTDDILTFQKKKYSSFIEKRKKIRKKILNNSDKVIVVSNFLKDLAKKIGVSEKKIKVIYNSIDFLEDEKGYSREELRKRFDLSGKFILTNARLTVWKGIDMLIELMPQLIKKYRHLKLIIISEGPERANLEKLTRDLGIQENVIFTGQVSRQQVVNYLKMADVFVLNTNYEGMSHVLLEAMKIGTPIITTRAGGNPETIEYKKTGLLVEYRNKKQWLEAINQILDNPDLAKRLVDKARQDLKRFSWDNLVEETMNIFRGLPPK